MIDENLLDQFKTEFGHMRQPVRLILFTRDVGCETCPEALSLAQAIKARAPKVALEVYDQVMDRDKVEQYGVNQVPATVVQAGNGRLIRFYGLFQDVFFRTLLKTILAASDDTMTFPENIRRTLTHLREQVNIQVFVETDCTQCTPVAETAIALALRSDLVLSDVIIASDFPDLIRKHSIKTLPRTIFGANLHMDGHVTESEFLEMIFEAEGVQEGPDRRCVSCGQPSPDIICGTCKKKIQAEAVEHKRKGEHIRTD
jgi:alkyl hydroperoxide reductase subunit AhpF